MARTIVGVFDTGAAAKRAVDALVAAGIPREDISLVAGDPTGEYARYGERGDRGDAGDRATSGATGGAILGGVLGLLAGLTTLAIPGIGPIIAAGPIAAALTGTALGAGVGAATGGLIGYLTEAGVPEAEAGYYAEAVRRGSTLVTVQASEAEAQRVAQVLEESGARDLEGMAEEWRRGGWTGFDSTAAPAASRERAGEERRTIPVTEERLEVGKRQVPSGGVRVYSRVTEQPVEEEVRLRDERVRLDRRPADRPATAADRPFQEASFEVAETAEEPVVAKRARVVEEIVVGIEAQERVETVRDKVRRTDVDVQRGQPESRRSPAAYGEFEADYRQHCARSFAGAGLGYEECAPAYRYGHTLATAPEYASREWSALESDARRRWEERNQGTWDRFKDSIRYAWDRARGRARAA
jgi:uncharacterized protein (TIGR02271 family)